MRPGQNKRMRGRPTNNRRGPNPLTRSYESNGPDVKIRGNAHHVAEKYLQLARDAHTSGDPVAAENYLQHAEHYFRLIAAAQAAQLQAQNGGVRPDGEVDLIDDDDDVNILSDRFASPSERAPAAYTPQPQPFAGQPPGAAPAPGPAPYQAERQPFEHDRPPQQDRGPYQPRQDRQDRQQNRPFRQDRQDRGDRNPNDQRPPREFRPYREPNFQQGQPQPQPQPPREPQPAVAENDAASALPSFITAAPRLPAIDPGNPQPTIPDMQPEVPAGGEAQGERFPGRGRRRRLRSPYGFHAGSNPEEGESAPPDPTEAPVNE